jgi:hypothetical protein
MTNNNLHVHSMSFFNPITNKKQLAAGRCGLGELPAPPCLAT